MPTNHIVVTHNSIALVDCTVDFMEVRRDIEAGRTHQATMRYGGRFLPQEDLCSAELRDWRDTIESETASLVAEALREQSYACSDADLGQLIDVATAVLTVHPDLVAAQLAVLEAYARLGNQHEVERLHRRYREDPTRPLPDLSVYLQRRTPISQPSIVRFSGRESELQSLQLYWNRVTEGIGHAVLILGEPGIGKTRLADHFLRRVAIQGGTVWMARCCAATQRLPYSVVSELIRDNIQGATFPDIMSLLGTLTLPGEASVSDMSSDQRRHQLTESLTGLVLARCEHSPMVIFVDDAQWADDYTALLLSYWTYRFRHSPVLILVTARTEEADGTPEWLTSDLGSVKNLHLGRISVETAADIVHAFECNHEIELDNGLRNAVIWQSGGRPFLLLEALSSIASDDGANTPTVEAILSEPAEATLRRRFRNLSRDATNVLQALAVWGHDIKADRLGHIASVEREPLVAAVDALCGRGIIGFHNGIISFPHDLMREAAYRSIPPATRALYHCRSAEAILNASGPVGLVAQHYAKGGEESLAAAYAMEAAHDALQAHSYSDYEFYCMLCIEHGSVRQRREAADNLGRFLVGVGRTSEVDRFRPLLQSPGGDSSPVLAILDLERDLASGNFQAAELLERAKTIIRDSGALNDPAAAAPFVATLIDIAFDAGADQVGLNVIEAFLQQRDTVSKQAQVAMESIVSVWLGVAKDIDRAVEQSSLIITGMSGISSPHTKALCLSSHATLLLLSARISEARAYFDESLELASSVGDVRRQLCILNNNGVALLESGDIERARQSFERVLTTPNVHSRIRGYGNLAILYFETGDPGNSTSAVEALVSLNATYGSPNLRILGHALLGLNAFPRHPDLARGHGHRLQTLIHDDANCRDMTYPALLLARLQLLDGTRLDAIKMLEGAVERMRTRDLPSALRLGCEVAAMTVETDPDRAFALAKEIADRASAGGAHLIEHRARSIVNQVLA